MEKSIISFLCTLQVHFVHPHTETPFDEKIRPLRVDTALGVEQEDEEIDK